MGKTEMLRPHWIKDSMTIESAGRVADFHNYTLKVSWNSVMGLRVIAVPKENENETD
jgi:hypothetical protein